jgi:hypothetical protein
MYQRCSFINLENMTHNKVATCEEQFHAQPERNQAPVNGSVLILWGKHENLFNQCKKVPSSRRGRSWKLKPGVYAAAEKDLTQDWVPDAEPEEPPAPEAAAAAAAVLEPCQMDAAADERDAEQEEHKQQDQADPALARASRPHRACAVRKRKGVDAGSCSNEGDDDAVLQSDDDDADDGDFGGGDEAMEQDESEQEAEDSADEDMEPESAPIPSACTAAAGRRASSAKTKSPARSRPDSSVVAARRQTRSPARTAKRARRSRQEV